ncbi:hypothetical protein [Simiduia agarivorans]|uniref:Uncharacterized protein n=1 Tax=Simiduia agarivorans (strain DSM 21679 / JCM 13881 / BCRC 17597 / SA1) TaxID=1117647 RepID=K4KJF3_SIMAS|nr:hypothetical protein [Simiduia agarivorans]AFU98128.1 hypothetical protein M5M_04605 [Simiduia agarivorans SA1 = DSM 21679]
MKHWLWITLLTTGLASWVLAQEPEQTTPEQPAVESEPVNTAPENAGYLPSEEISDDLSVSFPVDI